MQDGKMIPKIIYGTAWKKERTTALVLQALKAGFRGIDTACQPKHYREDLVGEAIETAISTGVLKREELFIQTKFTSIDGQDTAQPLPYDPSLPPSDQVTASISTSLANLRIPYIDSVILHGPLRRRADTLAAYRSLEDHVEKGVIGQIGVSNFYDVSALQWLWDEARVEPKVVQNRWYEGNEFDRGVWGWCRDNEVGYQSFWTLTGSPGLLSLPQMRKLGREKGATEEMVLYKLCQLWGITPLCGSTTLAHVQEALRAESIPLNADDQAVLELRKLVLGD